MVLLVLLLLGPLTRAQHVLDQQRVHAREPTDLRKQFGVMQPGDVEPRDSAVLVGRQALDG
jgi:hypothetical protein